MIQKHIHVFYHTLTKDIVGVLFLIIQILRMEKLTIALIHVNVLLWNLLINLAIMLSLEI
jgi:hypothetical protein